MKEKEITRWEFRSELMQLAIDCIGLKPTTIKKKVNNIFVKYQDIIINEASDRYFYSELYNKTRNKYEALKRGTIEWQNGVILLSQIEQAEIVDKKVLITTKSGREINLSLEYSYIIDLL